MGEIKKVEEIKNVILTMWGDDSLSMDALSDGFEENLFDDDTDDDSGVEKKENDNSNADVQINPDDIFKDEDDNQDDEQEIVGKDKDKEKVETPDSDDAEKGSSPKKSHSSAYPSIAKALKEDGVLSDLDDEFIDEVDSAEKFAEAIEKQVEARLEIAQKRIKEALDNNVPVDEIKRYENAINYLSGIDEDMISEESDEAENLRKNLIYQDFINKGFKPERAKKEVDKSFNAGTDIDDAKAALESNKEHFSEQYNDLIASNKEKARQEKISKEKLILEFKQKVLDTEDPLGLKVDKSTRQKVLDNIVKPVYKDTDGKVLTPLQKYSKENPNDAEYYFSLFYTMTDGFKNLDKLVGQKVKQKTKSSLRELESKLRNTPTIADGSVDFDFGKNDEDSYFGKGFKLDI